MHVADKQPRERWLLPLVILVLGIPPRAIPAEELTALKAVMIISNSSEVDTDASDAVQGYLADLPVGLVVVSSGGLTSDLYSLESLAQEVADKHDAKVVFAADFAHENRVLLYVSLPRVGTTLIRSIDCTNETVDSRFEAVAVIIRGILGAMVKGGEIGIHEPPPPPEPKPEPTAEPAPPYPQTGQPPDAAATPAEERPPRVAVSTAYMLSMLSDEVLMVHALRVSPTVHLGKGFRLFAGYRFTLPAEMADQLLEINITPHPVELGLAFAVQWERIMFEAAAAFIVDPIKWTAFPRIPDVHPNDEEREIGLRLGASPALTVGLPVTKHSLFYLAFSVDLFFYRPVFKIHETEENTTKTAFTFWIASPGVQVGLCFTLI